MVVNKGNYQISQLTGENKVKIFKYGAKIKELASKKDLSYQELLKILELYENS